MVTVKQNPKIKLDLILDRVEKTGEEVSVHLLDNMSKEQIKRVTDAAEKRGLHAAFDGHGFLIRKLRTKNPVHFMLVDDKYNILKRGSEAELEREAASRNKGLKKPKFFVVGKQWGKAENGKSFTGPKGRQARFYRGLIEDVGYAKKISIAEILVYIDKGYAIVADKQGYKYKVQLLPNRRVSTEWQQINTKNPGLKFPGNAPLLMLIRKLDNDPNGSLPAFRLSDAERTLVNKNKSYFKIVSAGQGQRVYLSGRGSKEIDKKHNPNAFSWENPNPRLWVLLYNGELLARLTKNNEQSYTASITRGPEKTFITNTLSNAKIKTLALARHNISGEREYRQSQPTVNYINKIISSAVIQKHGKAVRMEPVAFKPSVYRVYFEDGYSQESKIPKQANFTRSDFAKFTSDKLRELASMFQGEWQGVSKRIVMPDVAPKQLWGLGHLALIKIKNQNGKTYSIKVDDNDAYVAGDIRCNLWFVGRGARITDVKLPPKGEYYEVGKLIQVDYVTTKTHIEAGKLIRFWHKLGEATGRYPTAVIDHDGFIILIGGEYDIWDVGIVN